jgi:hypothetical protein
MYVWAFSVLQVLSALGRAVLRFKKPEVVSRYDVFESFFGLLSTPALFGYAYSRAYGPRWFWAVFTAVFLLMNVYQFFSPKMKQLYLKGWLPTMGAIGLQVALGGAALYALVAYSYLEPSLRSK